MIAAMIDGMIIGNALIDLGELFSSGYIAKYLPQTNDKLLEPNFGFSLGVLAIDKVVVTRTGHRLISRLNNFANNI